MWHIGRNLRKDVNTGDKNQFAFTNEPPAKARLYLCHVGRLHELSDLRCPDSDHPAL